MTNVQTEEYIPDVAEHIPVVGMFYDTFEQARESYNEYARKVGFSIRTDQSAKDTTGTYMLRAKLTCSREGAYKQKRMPTKKRDDTRCGCTAMVRVKFSNGRYVLTEFVEAHNHPLAPPEHRHLLRSQRKISESQSRLMHDMRSAGIGTSQINSFMRETAGGAHNVPFTPPDLYNKFGKTRRSILIEGDAQTLSKWFLKQKKKDPQFYYDFWLGENSEVRGVFFCDARSRRDYGLFGDVVCFDTTFNTNKYGMVCAPIVGVNNHWQTIVFGCGLLEGENTEAVTWVLNSFLEAMGGKMPITIFTDQSAAIGKAVETVLLHTHHRLCMWHIFQNAAKHLASTFSKEPHFLTKFQNVIYNPETAEEFEHRWVEMLATFELEDNDWLGKMWRLREKWVPVYGRQYFCAKMATTQRSEGINSFLKKYFPTSTILTEFVESYVRAMKDRREKVNMEENHCLQKISNLFSRWNVEREASQFYTLKLFNRFQEEIKGMHPLEATCEAQYGEYYKYSVYHLTEKKRIRLVEYDWSDQTICCSCKRFEFEGILCSHALKVLLKRQISRLPPKYYLDRWSRKISNEVYTDPVGEIFIKEVDPTMAEDYSELSHKAQVLVGMSVLSKPRLVLAREGLSELTERVAAIKIEEGPMQVDEDEENTTTILDPKGKKAAGQEKRRKKSVLEKLTKKKKTTKKTGDSSGQVDNATMAQPTVGIIPDLNDALPDLNAYQPPMTSWTMATNLEVPSQQYVSELNYANQQSYAPPTHQEPLGSNVNYGQPWFDESLTQESYFGYYNSSNQDGGDGDNNNNFY